MPDINEKTPAVDLTNYLIEQDVLTLIPETLARKYKIIPLFRVKNTLILAISDPSNVVAIDDARQASGCDIQTVKAGEKEILSVIDQNYNVNNSITEIIKAAESKKADFTVTKTLDATAIQKAVEEPPIVKILNLIIFQAVKDQASDIHIEPREKNTRVRLRIDGIMHNMTFFPQEMHLAVVSRIKVLANLNVVEMRLPQDGHFSMHAGERNTDFRVSTFPVSFGEKVEIRILNREAGFLGLERIGFSPEALQSFDSMIKKPHGIILVTGPTGSGKTSTLYSALMKMNSEEKNIITLEDPREYILDGINQGEINAGIDFTFARGLRAILRQDPNIIMVGEIRDGETAEIAMRAALTGHLVFSTLHTNDSVGTVTRLLDMGVEPFLISSTLIGVLAQRLVRVICPNCKEEYVPPEEVYAKLFRDKNKRVPVYHGKGCPSCHYTGYKGRIGIFELLKIDEAIQECIIKKTSISEVRQAALKSGMKTMLQDGCDKVLAGITTLEEVMRVTTFQETPHLEPTL